MDTIGYVYTAVYCFVLHKVVLSLQTSQLNDFKSSQLNENIFFFLESINLLSRTVSSLCKCISYVLKLVELGRSSAKFELFAAKHRTRGVYLLTTALTTFVYLLSFKLARQLRISRRRRLLIVYLSGMISRSWSLIQQTNSSFMYLPNTLLTLTP